MATLNSRGRSRTALERLDLGSLSDFKWQTAEVRVNPDGSSYSGEWKDGFPHGQGEWKAAEPSESYVGEWKVPFESTSCL